MPSFILHKAAPLVVFGGFTAMAVRLIGLNTLEAGTIDKLEASCVPNATYALPYTGFDPVDHALCQLVALFQAGMGSEVSLPIIQYFLTGIPVVSMCLYVEASRNGGRGVPSYIAYPVVFALSCQLLSWAFVLSVYSLFFTLSGAAQRTSGKITQQDALSIIIAFGVGAAFHTQVIYLHNPYMTALWQIFPVAVSLTQQLSRKLLPTPKTPTSGHDTIIAGYVLTFIASATFHFALVVPHLSIDNLITFLPSFAPVSRETGSLVDIMTVMMKWDMAIGSGAILLASMWFAKSFTQFVGLIVAIVGGTVAVGPAAALSGILVWREAQLSKQS